MTFSTLPGLIMATSLAALAFSGCGSGEEPPPPAGAPVRVVFKHQRMLGRSGDALAGILRAFEAAHPGVQVVSEVLPSATDTQHQFYVTNLEGGSRDFDVMSIDVVWVPELARAGWLLDLSGYAPPARVRAEHFAGPAAAVTWGGRTWALPWFADAGILYYRKDLLEKHGLAPPRTWDELAAAARRILAAEGDPRLRGYVWQGRQYEGLLCAALEVIRGFGGDVFDEGWRVALADPPSVRALAFLRGLIESGVSPPSTTSADEESCRAIFQSGEAVFMRNWPYALAALERAGSPVCGKVGVVPPPGRAPTLGGWQIAVNARTPAWKREAAAALALHLTSADAQRRMLEAYGLMPTRPEVFAAVGFAAAHPLAAAVEPALAAARPRPVTPYYLMISEILQPELSAAIAGIRRPADAMRRAAGEVRMLVGETP